MSLILFISSLEASLASTNLVTPTTYSFIDNNDIFVSIGNNDSFFGFYTPGRTIPLIFRFNPDSEGFSYVGTSGQIYSNVIKMFPLEDK